MTKPPSGDRKGRQAERLAALLLRLKGYAILARRYKSGQGEVDLIASRGVNVAFIEVKFRPSHEIAIESVSARQQARILAAASGFLARHPKLAGKTCRFDVILVAPGAWPRHILNAWTASDHNVR